MPRSNLTGVRTCVRLSQLRLSRSEAAFAAVFAHDTQEARWPGCIDELWSAGIDRHEEGDASSLHRGVAIDGGPESCASTVTRVAEC